MCRRDILDRLGRLLAFIDGESGSQFSPRERGCLAALELRLILSTPIEEEPRPIRDILGAILPGHDRQGHFRRRRSA